MSDYISELIKDYNGDSYEQFARYIYLTFQREIDASKGVQKNKYIQIRNQITSPSPGTTPKAEHGSHCCNH